jgi:hypothetical protein
MADLYLVCGRCGLDTDEKKWIVDVWLSRASAEGRVNELVTLLQRVWGNTDGVSAYDLFV